MTAHFQTNSRLNKNEWIVDPRIPDPDNLPDPVGWALIVRPYPVKNKSARGIILADETIDFANYMTNIGRVVKIGPCCWNRAEHRDKNGERFDWVNVGDFIEYPSNCGLKRTFKGVSFIVLMDDEIISVLPDPLVYEGSSMQMDIPEEDLKKYNSIYNKETN